MKVSIVIPIYQVAPFVERCLRSALNQTYTDVEYVLVDDASPDDSMSIVEQLLTDHPRRKEVKIVRHDTNKGLAAARNTGVRAASGDYIFFLDSDDELPADSLALLAAMTNGGQVDLVVGEIRVTDAERKAYPPLSLKDGIYYSQRGVLNAFFRRQWYEMAWNKLVKRSLFVRHDCWFREGILHEDNLWSFHLALVAQSMSVLHAETYIYHVRPASITQQKSMRNISDFLSVLQEITFVAEERSLFDSQPHIVDYLERLRIFFLKSLKRGNFDPIFRSEQRGRLNELYNAHVWTHRRQSVAALIREWTL